jgi:surfeit locus 1 family protein
MSRRPLAAAAAATLVGVAILIALGLWQLQRLDWKEALIAAAESRAHSAPVPAPPPAEWATLKPADYEYRRVEAQGVYDYADQKLLFSSLSEPRGRYSGVGYYVLTPLRLPGGGAIIVNRGFVPDDLKAKAEDGPRGEVKVTGLMRATEARNWFTPADEPQRGVFFARDVEALASSMKLGPHAPFVIDAEAGPDPLPQGGETRLSFVNNHLSYAFTWFGLAAALAGVFGTYAYGRLKG